MIRTTSTTQSVASKKLLLVVLAAVVAVCALLALPNTAQAAATFDDQVVIVPEPVPHDATHMEVFFYVSQPAHTVIHHASTGVALTGVTWNGDRTIATVPVSDDVRFPSGHVAIGISSFRMALLGGGFSSHATTVVAVLESPPNLPFIKELEMPVGMTLPSPAPSFDFNFDPVDGIRVSDSPVTYSRDIADFENLLTSPQSIQIDSTTGNTVGGTRTYTGQINLWDLFDLDFPSGGVFVWNVSEEDGSSNTAPPAHMSYDSARFQIWVWADRDGNLYDIRVFPIEEGEGEDDYTLGDKRENMTFTNRLSLDNMRLEISKTVTGQFADRTIPFVFDLTLTEATDTTLPSPITAHVYAYNTATPPVLARTGATVTITNGQTPSGGFTLLHGERLVITGLPLGTIFNVTERATVGYAPSAEVTIGGVYNWSGSATAGNSLATGNRVLSAATGTNTAAFTNNFELPPPDTGLFITSNVLVVLLALPVAALAVHVARRSRKAKEELPL